MTLNCWFYCSSIPGGIRDVERRSEHELHFKEKVKSQSNVKTDCDSVRPFGFEPLLGLLTTTSSVCWDHCLWFFRHILRRGYGSLNLQNLPLLWGNVFTYTYIYNSFYFLHVFPTLEVIFKALYWTLLLRVIGRHLERSTSLPVDFSYRLVASSLCIKLSICKATENYIVYALQTGSSFVQALSSCCYNGKTVPWMPRICLGK